MNRQTIALGAPFGGLFALLALIGFVVLLVGFGRSWPRLPLRARWLGVVVSGLVVIFSIWRMAIDAALQWNPTITDDSQVVGTYSGRRQTIKLFPDHTFTRQFNSNTERGTWRRDDWNLFLAGDSRAMRFVHFRGQYRLLIDPPDDPDEWGGDMGLRRAR